MRTRRRHKLRPSLTGAGCSDCFVLRPARCRRRRCCGCCCRDVTLASGFNQLSTKSAVFIIIREPRHRQGTSEDPPTDTKQWRSPSRSASRHCWLHHWRQRTRNRKRISTRVDRRKSTIPHTRKTTHRRRIKVEKLTVQLRQCHRGRTHQPEVVWRATSDLVPECPKERQRRATIRRVVVRSLSRPPMRLPCWAVICQD